MRLFFDTYCNDQKLAPLVREISWSKNIIIMEKCKDSLKQVSAFISVHLRFYKMLIFQTGFTGFTGCGFNPVHPVILSNLKRQIPVPEQIAKLLRGVD